MVTKSPNRKDPTSTTFPTGRILLTDDQVKFIENNGKIKLTDSLRSDINHTIDQYIQHSGLDKNAPRRKDIKSELNAVKQSVDHLFKFFADTSIARASCKAAREKIEAEL